MSRHQPRYLQYGGSTTPQGSIGEQLKIARKATNSHSGNNGMRKTQNSLVEPTNNSIDQICLEHDIHQCTVRKILFYSNLYPQTMKFRTSVACVTPVKRSASSATFMSRHIPVLGGS